MRLNTVELFSGTASFSEAALSRGHTIYTVDNNPKFTPTLCMNILILESLPLTDILWASPPCETFSVASISTHWTGGYRMYIPKTEKSILGLSLLDKTIYLIAQSRPTYWFVENPRGLMRKVIDPIFDKYHLSAIRRTVTYCQYGDTRMKPTDIWTNCDFWTPKPPCKNGAPCHVRAPRGARTGTQGLNIVDRGRVPRQLVNEIIITIEEYK